MPPTEADAPERGDALLQLCNANGLTEEDLRHPERVTHIEMVLDDCNCMRTLGHFPALRSVCLIQQNISKIEGLGSCPSLERLVLNENCIKEVEGLGRNNQLRKLYLCSNLIEELGTGLMGLEKLEVLWLAENKLSSLRGLDLAPDLKELNVARNQLTTVVGAFEGNPQLSSLNLADNRVCSFREVLDLTRLRSLAELCFSDPDWGENPICLLCNYQVYTLYHLPQLQLHDRVRVSVEDRMGAAAAFSKKALYYNMRMKLVKRLAADAVRAARTHADAQQRVLRRRLERAARVSKCSEAQALEEGTVVEKSEAMCGCLHEAADAELVWDAFQRSVTQEREAMTRSLEVELQTGGNIRLEPGRQESWAGHIESLVSSRYRASDLTHFGVRGLRVRQVTRVHNRSLRLRCDELLDRLEPPPPVEYLFHIGPDARSAAEQGPSAQCLLTDCVALAVTPELERAAGSEMGQAMARAAQRAARNAPVLAQSFLLVCGAYLHEAKADEASPGAPWPEGRTVFRGDPGWRRWKVQQQELVLPEYLVELEYVYDLAPQEGEQGLFVGLLRGYKAYTEFVGEEEPEETPVPTPQPVEPPAAALRVLNLHGRGLQRIEQAVLEQLDGLEALLLSFNNITSLRSLSCRSLTRLDASFNLLENVNALALPALAQLDLSWNALASADVIAVLSRDLPTLEVLALAGNPLMSSPKARVMVTARLRSLKRLDDKELSPSDVLAAQALDRQHVALTDAMVVEHSHTAAQKGSLSSPEEARIKVLLETAQLSRGSWRSSVDFADLANLGLTDLGGQLSELPQLRRLQLSHNRLTSVEPLKQCTRLEELYVEGNHLPSLRGIAGLCELQRLDAGSNMICSVVELQQLTKLRQLSLEDNHLESLDSFALLQSLVELYLSNNLIEDLRSVLLLKFLPKLLVLDLAGNELCRMPDYRHYSVFHLRRLKVLDGTAITPAEQQAADELFSGKATMELLEEKLGPAPTCNSLRVVDLSNQNLKELGTLMNQDLFPSLRELTLDSNPFTDIRGVGPLPKAQVLRMNRTKIDLERGMLGEQGGISALPQLQVLELGQCSIADISHFADFPLPVLRILHLPGNEISRVEGLSRLSQLRELVLDRNRIRQVDERSFEGLKSLRELRMEDNGLKSLANFGPLPRLRALHLGLNRIAELAELDKLRSLRHVLLINLSANPVARKPLYRSHVILAASTVRAIDGKEVTVDEREKVGQMQASESGQGLYVFTEQAVSYVVPSVASLLEAANSRRDEGRGMAPTSRSHSVPRHIGFEGRQPGSGR